MPKLTVESGADAGKVHYFTSSRVTIGRSVNNDIQIVDRRMSRNHAEVFRQGDSFFLRDLGSKNGTLHNGTIVNGTVQLRSGDLVQTGDSTAIYEDDTTHTDTGDTTVLADGLNAEALRRAKEGTGQLKLVDERQWGSTQGQVRAGVMDSQSIAGALALDKEGRRSVNDLTRRLEILYKVTEAIRSVFDIEELLEQIMEIIFEVIKPDRAYLLLVDTDSSELVPEVIKVRGEDDASEVKVSRSIVDRCIQEGVSLLVSDAAQDDRFSTSESIIINRIRTAMVAPVLYKSEKLGVVYVDTNTRMVPFAQEDLELLTGITNQAAMAITNARLHSQLVEQHKLAREMEIARTIQMNLLPKVYPDLDGYSLSAMSLPAKQVGGDYYDFLTLPDGRIALAVADVSGKGVPAAILTATTRSYLQSETQYPGATLVQTVKRINRMVHRDVTNDMYVTMVLMYMDARTSSFEYVNAGHSHPAVLRADGTLEFLDSGGLFLGIMADNEYEAGTLQLDPGDILLLSTDGVSDIQNAAGEQFGSERLYALLRKNQRLDAEGIRNAIYKECMEHRGDADQFDDFTLIILKRQLRVDSSFEEMDFD
ncbi:MAG: phosphoserine phosphatase RsbU/P [Candidatus Sumerlaeota bacterium]|nr:phosphoserine phosphatase RsbU/P [Candidatus Sumerlaeota bacterium]